VPSPLSGAGGGSSGRNGDYYQSTPIPTGPRNGTNSMPGPPNQDNPTVTASPSRTFDNPTDGMPSIGSSAAPPTDAELAIIRQRYLGAAPPGEAGPAAKKPRARKLQDKKFVFDWDASEDTSSAEVGTWRDEMANGNRAVGVGVGTMFGGRLAGYDEGGRSKATSRALEDHHADALERRRAAKHGHDDRHWTEKPLVEMKDRDWRIFREDFSISARGGNIPHPMRNWRESGIPEAILNIIDEIGYKEPSPIQRQAIPIGLKNRDLIGIAQTGSGKTASFVIPMLEYISHLAPLTEENMHLGPYALIMAPTRELAQQIESETKRFAGPMGYKTVSIVGGKAVEEQQFNLREGAEIVIATPGRLKDIIDRNIMVLSQCRYVVMDEADRMVDLGFEEELNYILGSMPADYAKPEDMDVDDYVDPNPELDKNGGPQTGWKGLRVTTLFSATMPPIVERLARKYLRKPATVVIGNAGEAVETVEQRVEFIQGDEKRKLKLQEILRTIGLPPPMIVFVNQKKTADMVVKYVQQAGVRIVASTSLYVSYSPRLYAFFRSVVVSRCIPARTRNSERLHCNLCEMATWRCWSLPIW
jgi:ATP-dependent RNA helicase DDX23/PRP28